MICRWTTLDFYEVRLQLVLPAFVVIDDEHVLHAPTEPLEQLADVIEIVVSRTKTAQSSTG